MAPLNLKQLLKDFVTHHISLSDDKRKENMEIMKRIVEVQLINKMKETEPLFKEIYNKVYYTGSYYENLKVGETDEFDLNIILNLPFKEGDLTIDNGGLSGFAQYRLNKSLESLLMNHPKFEIFKKLTEFFDSETHTILNLKKINAWMTKVVDKALNAVNDDPTADHSVGILRSTSGPASTVNLIKSDGTKIDVDLVPVIPLTIPAMQTVTNNHEFIESLPELQKTCFMVPKPPPITLLATAGDPCSTASSPSVHSLNSSPRSGHSTPNVSNSAVSCPVRPANENGNGGGGGDRNPEVPLQRSRPPFLIAKSAAEIKQEHFFRVSMPNAERYLIKDKKFAKTLIRIFKALRDHEKWTFIASYHIKTMFLWKLSEHPESQYWEEGRMEELFIEMLKEFRDRIESRNLPHILFPDYNLLSALKESTAISVKGRLDAIITMVEKRNFEQLEKLFPGKP